jgi:hypothetical protein
VAAVAAAQVDEESSSNVKPADQPEPGHKTEAEAEEGGQEAEKKKRRRRKATRGFSLCDRKRARRERKLPAPKAEVVEPVAPRAVADRAVAQVYAATEAAEEKEERKVAVRTERKRKREDERARGVAKRPRKVVLPKKEEEAVEVEEDERRVARRKEAKRNRKDGRAPKKLLPKKEEEAVEPESGQDERKAVVFVKTERKSRRKEEPEPETKPAPDNKLVKVEEPGGKGRAMVDRWTALRYKAAEAALLSVVRSMGARAGTPVPRRQLRDEARKRIGDTGLLDHLLKHTKDKVIPGGSDRLRRRHNADGAMEYWLEPAGLAALRREAGVADPYWVPPPGWKLGDPVSADACALVMKRQVEELATELARVKRCLLFLKFLSFLAFPCQFSSAMLDTI